METIEHLLHDVPLFEGLTPAELELIAGCGSNVRFRRGRAALPRRRPGRHLLRRSATAASRSRRSCPARGAVTIETLEAGEVRRLVVALPAVPLALRRAGALARARDELRRRLPARQVRERPAARLRPDVPLRAGRDRAAPVDEAAAPRRLWLRRHRLTLTGAPGPMAPVPFRVTRRRRELARHVDARARARRGRARSAPAPGQFTMLYAFGIGEVPISVSGDARRPARPHRARRRRGHAGDLRGAAGRGARRARAVRQRVAGRGRGRQRRRRRRRRHRARAAPARRLRACSRAAATTARWRSSTAAGRPADLLYSKRARAAARPLRPPGRRHRRHAPRAAGAARSASCRSSSPARASTRRRPSRSSAGRRS